MLFKKNFFKHIFLPLFGEMDLVKMPFICNQQDQSWQLRVFKSEEDGELIGLQKSPDTNISSPYLLSNCLIIELMETSGAEFPGLYKNHSIVAFFYIGF